MKWCETLLTYSFNTEFVSNYNINSNKLKRRLTSEEALKNQKIILEHALKVLTKLITLQYGPALYLMATLYSHQPYLDIKIQAVIVRNDAKALDYYTRAAALNESEACYRAGVCYEYQRGTPTELDKAQCLQKAVYFFDRGATQCGNTACMYKLAMLLLHGVNEKHSAQAVLQQDVKAAMHWFKKAAAESAPRTALRVRPRRCMSWPRYTNEMACSLHCKSGWRPPVSRATPHAPYSTTTAARRCAPIRWRSGAWASATSSAN